jgi:hypothetical protein
MEGVGQASGVRGPRSIQNGRWPGLEFLLVVLAELRRARAAEQRYENLRRAGAAPLARDGIVPADIPRRIFDEFYSSAVDQRAGARTVSAALPLRVNHMLKW